LATPPPAAAPRRFGRALVAGVAVALLVIGGAGGFVLGRTTGETHERPGIGDHRNLPPGFDGPGRQDFPGGRPGPRGDQNDGPNGGQGGGPNGTGT
jgi:hypothetical protein